MPTRFARRPHDAPPAIIAAIEATAKTRRSLPTDAPVEAVALMALQELWDRGYTLATHRQILAMELATVITLVLFGAVVARLLLVSPDDHLVTSAVSLLLGMAIGAVIVARTRPAPDFPAESSG